MVQIKNILLPALTLVASVYASAVKDLTPTNFDDSVFSGSPSLVEFFAPWCGHCKRLAPTYDELADSFSHAGSKVNIAKVDGDAHKELSQRFGISGFPTIKYFDGKSKEPADYTGGRDLEALQGFISEKTGIKARKAAQAPSDVEMLTDNTFADAVGKEKDVFVAFTAPWCGHCKTLAPTWESLAHSFSGDKDTVSIAKVDAEANKGVATSQSISSFPTIKFFPKGSSTPVDYSGGRDEKSFVEFVNEKAGTHRVPGGGLDAKAGTVASLDELVSKLTGSNTQEILGQAQTAAKGLKDQYAAYYVKVLEKVKENSGYVEKETGRLQGLLKKGGLAQAKEDDLISRLNILKRFGVDEETKENIKQEL